VGAVRGQEKKIDVIREAKPHKICGLGFALKDSVKYDCRREFHKRNAWPYRRITGTS
jgi:hypothetical protein